MNCIRGQRLMVYQAEEAPGPDGKGKEDEEWVATHIGRGGSALKYFSM